MVFFVAMLLLSSSTGVQGRVLRGTAISSESLLSPGEAGPLRALLKKDKDAADLRDRDPLREWPATRTVATASVRGGNSMPVYSYTSSAGNMNRPIVDTGVPSYGRSNAASYGATPFGSAAYSSSFASSSFGSFGGRSG